MVLVEICPELEHPVSPVISLLDTEKGIRAEIPQYVHRAPQEGMDILDDSTNSEGARHGYEVHPKGKDTYVELSAHGDHPDRWEHARSVATTLTGSSICRFQIRDTCTEIDYNGKRGVEPPRIRRNYSYDM